MLVTCICVCHNKPDLAREAIESIVRQSYSNWEALVVDSGVLYDAGYYNRFPWRRDQRIKLIRSDETEATRRVKAMAPWCFNECFRRGLVRGDLVMYLCDDDILYPNAFATFVSCCRRHPHVQAMYASQDVGLIDPSGRRVIIAERRATRPGGTCCNGVAMDRHVDYLQFCHRTEVLRSFPSEEYWPEGQDSESHADGIFMERVGERVPIFPIDVKVSQNRRTPHSTYTPLRSAPEGECLIHPAGERIKRIADPEVREAALWTALDDCRRRLEELAEQNRALRARSGALRYRVADRLHALCTRVPGAGWCVSWLRAVARRMLPPPRTNSECQCR
jgi:glycosyltransferase involved in cell wall biosynthesis